MSPSFPNVEKETAVAMAATDGKSSAAPSDFNDGDARLSSFSSDPKIKTMQNSVDPETASSSLSGCVKNLEVVDLVGCSSSDSDAVGLNRSIEPRKDMRVVSNGRSELAIHDKGSVSVGHGSPGVAVGIVINGSIERAAAESGKGNSSNGTVVGGIGAEAGNVHIIFQVQPEPSGLDLRTEMVDAANEKESVGKIESAVEASTKKDDNPQNKDPDKALSLTPSAFGGNKPFEASSATFQKRVASLQFDQPPTKKAKEKEGFDPQTSIGGEKVISETVAPPRPSIATAEREQSDSIVPTINNPVLPAEKDAVHPPSVSLVKQGHDSESDMPPECDPFFASIVDLSPIPNHDPLPVLRPRDVAELESALHIGDKYKHSEDGGWREDWSGNLQLVDKEIVMNRGQIAQDPQIRVVTLPFVEWSAKVAGVNPNDFRGVHLLFSYVHHMKGTPPMAQRILAHSLCRPAKTVDGRLKYIVEGVRRISYDPTVLTQDGWTTAKAKSPDGASGGAFLIGRRVIWHRYEAIVIAFVRDEEIGDLWKAMWIEDHDTFDLEADELQDALKKWERKEVLRQKKLAAGRQTLSGTTAKPQGLGKQGISGPRSAGSMRFAASSNLTVKGIEHGIILASPTHPNARPGVPWPARVMHVSEVKALTGSQLVSRRSSSKNIIHVVFLAPYWNGGYAFSPKKNAATTLIDPLRSGSVAATAQNPFSTGILFEMETIEVSDSTIKNYPFDLSFGSLSPDKLSAQFRFIGLPKAAFPRYLASHRLAMAFKAYARQDLAKSPSPNDSEGVQSHAGAFAALTETHPLSVRTKIFPQAALDLPFEYILSGLPDPFERSALSQNPLSDGDEALEKVLDIHAMLQLLTPPTCWGVDYTGKNLKDKKEKCIRKVKRSTKMAENTPESPRSNHNLSQLKSPDSKSLLKVTSPINDDKESGVESSWSLKNFASEYLLGMIGMGSRNEEGVSYKLSHLGEQLSRLVGEVQQKTISADKLGSEERVEIMRTLLHWCLATKGHGEDFLFCDATFLRETNTPRVVVEWRKACERIYRRVVAGLSITGFGDGTTCVLTDFRCNQHITASGSFERAVRLPAALKGARMAGAGMKETIPLVSGIDDKYVQLAESKILTKAHKASYLKRIKAKINSLPPEAKGMPLTDDSDGEGGEDTMGSKGSYTAAVVGVAAALQGADMIVRGRCVNVFCAVRPPGHHAGRELRPMNAISNGFCLLNAAACAALYATAPCAEGGLGLRRVCIIDFDVHHGNGTQDILCSTHDPRFFYVSLHAGGAHINGYKDGGETHDGFYHGVSGSGRHEGIFPGRCGDTSPHEGVLNIPLGKKVTAAAVGNALVTTVAPAVEVFSPELIILSAGFDAHKNDPLGMGGLSAEDFGSVTEVACQIAFKSCNGRVLSVMEGGYGVPCCRPRNDTFLPDNMKMTAPIRLLDLGSDLPESMEDSVTPALQQKLDRCHQEGFLECVRQHVGSLAKCNRQEQ